MLAYSVEVEIDSSGDGVIPSDSCEDTHPECLKWSQGDGCVSNFEFMGINCRKSCFVCDNISHDGDRTIISNLYSIEPQVAEGDSKEDTIKVIQKTDAYMETIYNNSTMKAQWTG